MEIKKIKQLINENKVELFYKSSAWKRKRLEILARDNYECQECKKEGKVTSIQDTKLDVHHIKELKEYPELALNNDNLVTVCVHHHNYLDNKGGKGKNIISEERW